MKRFLLIGLLVIVMAAGGVYAFRTTLTLRLMSRQLAANFASDLIQELPDGLHVALCGAGSPLPDPARSGPCTAVVAGGQLFIVDSGAGSSRILARMRIPQAKIAAVFGSFGWSGEGVKMVEERLKSLRFKLPVASLSCRFSPTDENLEACRDFARIVNYQVTNPDAT